MGLLSNCRVGAGLAVSDMARARAFYEDRLGFETDDESMDNRAYAAGEGTVFHVYVSPVHAGRSTATLLGIEVDDIEGVVAELKARGVVFDQVDEPPVVTDADGIAHFAGNAKVAYFKDPDGNVLSLAQPPRT